MTSDRYSAVAITLHWLIAAYVLALIPAGLWMHRAIEDPAQQSLAYDVFQLHKSLGLTVLGLSLLRLAWRLFHAPPPLPQAMPVWEKLAAQVTHIAFYALILAMPLTGWLYVSTGWSLQYSRAIDVPTIWFGIFHVPHLPFFAQSDAPAREAAAGTLLSWHYSLAMGALALVTLHVAAAVKHHFADRDDVFARMAPAAQGKRLLPAAIAGAATCMLVLAAAIAATPHHHPEAEAHHEAAPAPVAAAPIATAPTPASAAPPSAAPARSAVAWNVDKAASKITFSGTAPSGAFTGVFKNWTADIRFGADDLAHSNASVTIAMADAQLPDPTGTTMLKQDDWFAADKFPTAKFTAASFKHRGGGEYVAEGTLTIRDKTVSVALPFTLFVTGKRATMRAALDIDRIAFAIGATAGETLVSRTIKVDIVVVATAQ
jgi:cytochrome b561